MPNMKLIISIINYLKDELNKEQNPDTTESLEVAVQCLQTAYDLDPNDNRLNQRDASLTLEDIFVSALTAEEEIGDDNDDRRQSLKKAETMKNLGNNLMRNNQFSEAIRYYSSAIEIDSKNAVYYCNRAAAYSRLNEFQNAIKDCEKAIEIDPKYAKAYGRMGLAYTSINLHDAAIKALKKAVDLEPGNESYQSNLKIAMEKKEKPPASAPTGLLGLGNVDWHTLFSNPAFRNMATNIMQDPNLINVLSAGMSQAAASLSNAAETTGNGSGTSGTNAGNSPSVNRGLDILLEAGQYLTAQMEAANPDLVEQLRLSSRSTGSQNKGSDPPPPPQQ